VVSGDKSPSTQWALFGLYCQCHMHPLILFGIIAFASAVGSLQLGPVNGIVMRTALHDYRKALLITVGGTLPEAAYAAVAIASLSLFSISHEQAHILHLAGSGLLALFGIYFIVESLEPQREQAEPLPKLSRRHSPIMTGFLYGIANIQLLFFWATILGYTSIYISVADYHPGHVIAVLAGSILGAFITDYAFAFFVHKHKERLLNWISPTHMNRIVGIILTLFGGVQLLVNILKTTLN